MFSIGTIIRYIFPTHLRCLCPLLFFLSFISLRLLLFFFFSFFFSARRDQSWLFPDALQCRSTPQSLEFYQSLPADLRSWTHAASANRIVVRSIDVTLDMLVDSPNVLTDACRDAEEIRSSERGPDCSQPYRRSISPRLQ